MQMATDLQYFSKLSQLTVLAALSQIPCNCQPNPIQQTAERLHLIPIFSATGLAKAFEATISKAAKSQVHSKR